MKKKKRSTLGRAKDKFFDSRPNIYKFIIDRGLDDGLANDAQDFVTEAWLNASSKNEKKLLALYFKLERKLKGAGAKLDEFIDTILD